MWRRYPLEADALSVRCAVLLDEMERQGQGHIILELKTSNALPLVKFSCSSRIVALPTTQLNARRSINLLLLNAGPTRCICLSLGPKAHQSNVMDQALLVHACMHA